jgi:Bacteriophage HK97-gp10, putative tail-component
MGYTGGKVEDLLTDAEHVADRAVRRMADEMGNAVTAAARALAPVAERDPHRPPGTYRASLQQMDVERFAEPTGSGYVSGVVTKDPIAHLVEWGASAHVIRPRIPGGVIKFRTIDGQEVETDVIHHPGASGQHVVGTALATAEAAFPEVGEAVAEAWAAEQDAAAQRR